MAEPTPPRVVVAPGQETPIRLLLHAVRLIEAEAFMACPSTLRATYYWRDAGDTWHGKN